MIFAMKAFFFLKKLQFCHFSFLHFYNFLQFVKNKISDRYLKVMLKVSASVSIKKKCAIFNNKFKMLENLSMLGYVHILFCCSIMLK